MQPMDFRHAYLEHQREVRTQLKAARGRGYVRLASGEVDATRLTDRQIEDLALRDAERVVNIAIHQWNEECERNARK